ncbi:SDR family oxidoreductase [Acidihalobacter prosperus]|uniref:NAD(P)-dependent oxidoreductase n=1 Tax=Acidihalobacter prosperus TaxID=160660 RepID=A0A1A6C4U8_9GAMM|nr:SDR family oxidoreductase [Acidihalobacter prosperus]OBS09583.1 NAD(P)-dependent oxidoreductase [Acidihalobacter prosperus]
MTTTLIIGCGYVGTRVAQRLRAQPGHTVVATTQRPERAERLRDLGVEAVALDLDGDDIAGLPLPEPPYRLLYLVAPPPQGEVDTRLQRVLRHLADHAPTHTVYVGTTGIYGNQDGRWVDEQTAPKPASARAYRRLDAESRFTAWCAASGSSLTRLRVAGIYGPDRLPLDRIRQGQPIVIPAQAPWSNRIQVEDLATVCLAALSRTGQNELFNVTDGNPSSTSAYVLAVADACGLAPPPCIPLAQAIRHASPAGLSYLTESRRIDIRRLRDALGFTPQYPDVTAYLAENRLDPGYLAK